jgi:hypothetical protein
VKSTSKPSRRNPAQSQIVNAAIQVRRSNAQDDTEDATKSVNRRVTGWDQMWGSPYRYNAHICEGRPGDWRNRPRLRRSPLLLALRYGIRVETPRSFSPSATSVTSTQRLQI